jgi:molybdopterin-containing oxidoreductase family iron-sulfur binding subunit
VVTCPYSTRYYLEEIKNYVKGEETPYEKKGKKKHKKGAVEKCDFCLRRIEKGLQPACVTSCVASARYFGDLDDSNSEVSKLIALRRGYTLNPELGTEPAVYYLPDY